MAGAFALADVYQEAKRHGDAIALLTPLASAHPDDDAIAFRLGAAYDPANHSADAERTFRGILARDPLNANALNYLGYMLANRGVKLAEALALVDRALAVEPGNPLPRQPRLGAVQAGTGRRCRGAAAPGRRPALRGSSVIQSHFAEVLDVAAARHRGRRAPRAGAAGRRRRDRSRRARTSGSSSCAAAADDWPRPGVRWSWRSVVGACASRGAGAPGRHSRATTGRPSTALRDATRHCRPLRTATAEMRLSGRAGRERIRARLLAGFAAPASLRLEVLAPFGAPALVLAAADGARDAAPSARAAGARATRQSQRCWRRSPALALDAADLRRCSFGCVVDGAGRRQRRGLRRRRWQAVEDGEARAFLRRGALVGGWTTAGWRVDYGRAEGGVARDDPRAPRTAAGDHRPDGGAGRISTNVDLDAARLHRGCPADATPITLDELRRLGPLAPSLTAAHRMSSRAARRCAPTRRSTWTCACSACGPTATTTCAPCFRRSRCTTRSPSRRGAGPFAIECDDARRAARPAATWCGRRRRCSGGRAAARGAPRGVWSA